MTFTSVIGLLEFYNQVVLKTCYQRMPGAMPSEGQVLPKRRAFSPGWGQRLGLRGPLATSLSSGSSGLREEG